MLSTLLLVLNRAFALTLTHILVLGLVITLLISVIYFSALPYTLLLCAAPNIYYQTACTVLYLSHLFYLILVISILLYLLPNISMFTSSNLTSTSNYFTSLGVLEIAKFIYTFPLITLVYHFTWVSPSVTLWFGHLTFSIFQFKVFYILSLMFMTYLLALFTTTHASSLLVYDYMIVLFHIWLWVWVLFFSNNLFSLIFFIELLSISITLLLITNVFTSTYFYNLTSYSKHSYFSYSYPTTFLQTLLTFFWMTLVSSLLLFFFITLFYLVVLTFDLNLIGLLFTFMSISAELSSLTSLSLVWFLFILCIFIKGGIVPFFLWKPSFFKGISYLALFFYIYIYYFALFVYLIYCVFFLLNELLLLYLYLLVGLLSLGAIMISGILFESFYIKAFLALSSILNSLILFFAITSLHFSTESFTSLY